MKTLTKRILLTVFGVPIFLSTIFFFPMGNFILFTIVALGFSVLGSYEMSALTRRATDFKPYVHPVIVGLLPGFAYIELYLVTVPYLVEGLYLLTMFAVLVREIFTGDIDGFSGSIRRTGLSVLHILYPSALCLFVIRMTAFTHADLMIVFFFMMIFANDVFAYVFGMLLGRSSRGVVTVSPNKSLVGFLGGFASALLIASLFYFIAPQLAGLGSLGLFLVLAGIVSISADIGDLAESVLKRSSQIKDSGTIIPGRGGVLDTIDSIVFAAPLFYYASILLLKV